MSSCSQAAPVILRPYVEDGALLDQVLLVDPRVENRHIDDPIRTGQLKQGVEQGPQQRPVRLGAEDDLEDDVVEE